MHSAARAAFNSGVGRVVARRPGEQAPEQASIRRLSRSEVSLKRTDAVFEGDGGTAHDDGRPILVDGILGHVTVKLEILVEAEGEARLAKCFLLAQGFDGRLVLSLLDLIFVDQRRTLPAQSVVWRVKCVLPMLLVARSRAIVLALGPFISFSWRRHLLVIELVVVGFRVRIGSSFGRFSGDRGHTVRKVLLVVIAVLDRGHEVLMNHPIVVLVASSAGGGSLGRHLELLGSLRAGGLVLWQIAMLGEQRLGPVRARVRVILPRLEPAQCALGPR